LQGEEDCPCAHALQAAKRPIHSGKAPVRGVLRAWRLGNHHIQSSFNRGC